ncbi:MAG: hypothetical protein KIT33_04140 [Candidatus Kapabacteria bacterium]|nr:hypothetical protein [Ignavibacteriota bacterium]MCW5884145.1 hypothetical protein [Candidatus Kapabacteria bacterium]
MNDYDNPDVIICSCHSVEHQLVVQYDEEIHNNMIFLSVHLRNERFFKRLIIAFKYIFKIGSTNQSQWDEIIVDKRHIPLFRKILNFLEMSN